MTAGPARRASVNVTVPETASLDPESGAVDAPDQTAGSVRTRRSRLARRVGQVLVVLGLLAVLFVPFQLWGTALYQYEAQATLRQQLEAELGGPLPGPLPATTADKTPPARLAAVLGAPTAPPAVGDPVADLVIPVIGVSQVVIEGVGADQLRRGPGHYPGTPLPGQPGNASIAGHRTTYAAPFYDLNVLRPGDYLYVRTTEGLFRYSVIRSHIVAPSDVAVLDSAPAMSTLTLTTCNPRYSASQRLVVVAAFSGDSSTGAAVPPTAAQIESASPLLPAKSAGLGGASSSMLPVLVWGLATVVVIIATRLVWKRTPRKLRWLTTVLGSAITVVGLFLCFTAISLALPASF
ncbi:MAG: class E sortase [Acidimicrobiales bacterium]